MTAATVTIPEYAALQTPAVTERTVRRWLSDGEIHPTPIQDNRGKWWIEATAIRRPRDLDTIPASSGGAALATTSKHDTLSAMLDRHTAYLDVPTAARFLGINEGVVRKHWRELDGRNWGGDTGQSIVIPQSTIRRILGIA
jgi:hypothetical protein